MEQDKQSRVVVVDEDMQTLPRRLLVGKNLVETFQHLRYVEKPRILWVDAICINQVDENEKGHQILHMNEVYQIAHQVFAWLGPASQDSRLALSTLEYLGKQFEFIPSLRACLQSPDAEINRWWDPSCELPYEQDIWAALDALFSRTWFGRLWVVREIQLANTQPGVIVYCGHDTIP